MDKEKRYKMNKKRGILQSEVFTYILMGLGVILLLILAVNFISKFQEQRKTIEFQEIKEEIRTKARLLANDIGTVKKSEFKRPENLKYLCMVNLAKKDEAMDFPLFKEKFPEIIDILNSGAKKNTFLMSDNEVLDSAYIDFLCPQAPKATYCKLNPTDLFEIYFIGVPGCTSVSGSGGGGGGGSPPCDPSECNKPNPIYFCGQEVGSNPDTSVKECNAVFFVEDKEPSPYQDILKVVPATQFPNIDKNFPYFAYYVASGDIFDRNDVIDLIQKKNNESGSKIDTAIMINGDLSLVGKDILVAGQNYSIYVRDIIEPTEYIKFWDINSIKSISLVPKNSSPIALKAALHAAKMSSSPLFFIDTEEDLNDIISINRSDGSSLLSTGIKVYVIENENEGIRMLTEVSDKLNDLANAKNITLLPRDTDFSPFIDELTGEWGYDTKLGSTVAPKN